MTTEQLSTQDLLILRKLTRAIADLLRGLIRDYLATLTPLLRPTRVLGEYVQGTSRGAVKGADRAFKELQELYQGIAAKKPFEIAKELNAPIEILSSTPEITPVEYIYVATGDRENKTIMVTSPLRWALTYSGFAPAKLRSLLLERKRETNDLPQYLLHYLVAASVVSRQAGLTDILAALHFPVEVVTSPEFGQLPVVTISAPVSTFRPADPVIIESTEISGVNVFEEIVRVEDLEAIRNPLKDRLLELAQSQAPSLDLGAGG